MKKQKAPRLVVAGLIKNKGKYLLIKEKMVAEGGPRHLKGRESGRNLWIVPGGGVELGESLEEAVKREVLEEVGIKVENLEFLMFKEAVFPDFNYHTVIFFYQTESDQPAKLIEPKILEAKFFRPAEIKKLPLVESAQWLFKDLGVI
jgi:8-oxo-dGTP diphosphatase